MQAKAQLDRFKKKKIVWTVFGGPGASKAQAQWFLLDGLCTMGIITSTQLR
jgi:hypothetical protein